MVPSRWEQWLLASPPAAELQRARPHHYLPDSRSLQLATALDVNLTRKQPEFPSRMKLEIVRQDGPLRRWGLSAADLMQIGSM